MKMFCSALGNTKKAWCSNSGKAMQAAGRSKDEAKLYGQVVRFFEDQGNRRTLNQMKQLLGRQRKEEEYLFGEREYKPRVK